jgi:hypothetical protein
MWEEPKYQDFVDGWHVNLPKYHLASAAVRHESSPAYQRGIVPMQLRAE